MSLSDDDDDIKDIENKLNDSDKNINYSDTEELKEQKSVQNSNKNQNEEQAIKEAPKEEKKITKKKDSSSDSEDSSEERKKKKTEDKKQNENKKEIIKEDTKEKKQIRKESSSSSSSSSSSNKKKKQNKKIDEKEKERIEKEKNEKEERERKEREKKMKEHEEEMKKKDNLKKAIEENQKKENERPFNPPNNNNTSSGFRSNNNNYNNSNTNYNNNFNRSNNPNSNMNSQSTYVKKKGKKYDLNTEKLLTNIISENSEIIEEMRNAYPGIPKLDCANILKKLKGNTASQTLFEIMNKIHKEITNELTLNRANESIKNNLYQIDPYEIIDSMYNNPEHVKIMKYYKIYSFEDKDKLPPYLQDSLPSDYYYNKNNEKEERRRKLIKYSDGSFNYIPLNCSNLQNCSDKNCPYSHNNNENNYHPLFYKTIISNNLKYNNDTKLIKNACDFFDDFRIIYNYKNEHIINLMKLIEEKKLSKLSFRDYMKNKISSFSLNTFKTLECPSIKSGITCPKGDSHLCYYYHDASEKRRPPSLYRYINEMCKEQVIKKGKIKERCKLGDFCNKCHSKYEYYYHKLFYGKAMTCQRPKKFGKCIYEETCYAYHPYKEPGYKRSYEEIYEERKDEVLQKYYEEDKSLGNLIEKFRCPECNSFKKKLKYCMLLKCEHIICEKCFKKIKKCPKCGQKFQREKEGEDYIQLDIITSSNSIDELMKKKYEKKKEEEKNEEKDKNKKTFEEDKKEENLNKKEKENKNEEEEEDEDDDNKKDANASM